MPSPAVITVTLNPTIDRLIEVDHFTVGAHQAGRDVMRTAGGKGVNVSRVLAALGVRNFATGFLGEDNRGEFDALFQDPLIQDELFNLPGRTRENVTIMDRHSGLETHIRAAGLAVPAKQLARLTKKLHLLAADGSMLVFSGSLPPGIDPRQFVELVASCQAAGALVAVDTSGDALAAMAGRPLWIVKPNAVELPLLAGRELVGIDGQLAAARELTGLVENVIFTVGADGAYLFSRDLALHARVDVPAESIRNTVGCGDALLGAFVAALRNGATPGDAFPPAVACAAASAMTLTPGKFDPQTLADLRAKVELAEV